jgi:DNA polymerase-3 subunit alpha
MSWVPLHVYSQFSVLEASCSVEAIAERAAQLKMGAVALTDQGNLYGAVEFYKAVKEAGLKPIIGCTFFLAPGSRFEKKKIPGSPAGYPLVLLAKNKQGYHNLCMLSSLGFLEGFYYTPRIDKELLFKHSEGLICLTGPANGYFGSLAVEDQLEKLKAEIAEFRAVFKEDLYFEVQRHAMTAEEIRSDALDQETWAYQNHLDYVKKQEKIISCYKELQLPCVATTSSRYIARDDWRAHEVLINIQSGEPCEIWEKDSFGNLKARILNPKRQKMAAHTFHFRSADEMTALFADFPEAITNAALIAEKCQFQYDFKAKNYPVFIPPGFETGDRPAAAEAFLRQLCEKGIAKRYTAERLEKVAEKYPGQNPLNVVRERLKYELDIITSKGMGDYLLIVYDFIAWAKNEGIPMGPGRGSGAGSIILYLIGITDIEPLRFNLFFERFINPERISYPDIDVDICMDRRSEVIDYTIRKYGKDRVAQIITFGTMKAKMAVKDVGRVLSVPLAKVNALSKLIPEDPTMTLEKALEIDQELKNCYETDEEAKRIIDLALKLEGSVRSTGIHAAGMIIGSTPLIDHIPLCLAKDSDMVATQFSMKPVEAVGMLKIDFLGLKTLTSIQKAADAVKTSHSVAIDWVNLPLDDQKTFDLLNEGQTLGVFQVESGGMTDLTRQVHVDKFEEVIAIGALYRPGPMEMIPSFIARKHGRETIEIDHPKMNDVLAETYGIMVYQEQVMQIASLLAGYSLGEGDVLRRAMGKKDKEEMARQREKFRKGALENKINEQTSMQIFDKIEKFASYGFNKSHAAAYGYLTYVTAYFKAHYPGEWMAALLTCDREDIGKVAKIIRECQAMDLPILPPDVNDSLLEFAATPKGIRFALTAIKGVGDGVAHAIIKERGQSGPFLSLYDFVKRVDGKKIGKKAIELLIEAGCFDFTKWSRPALIESVDPMVEAASQEQKEVQQGVMSFFSIMDEEKKERFVTAPPVREEISPQKMLRRENELLGFYLTGHPLDDYRPRMEELGCMPLSEVANQESGTVCKTGFIIETLQLKISKTQRKFAILSIGDQGERFELPVWPEMYESRHHLLLENQLIYAVVQVDKGEGDLKLQCRFIEDLAKVDEEVVKQSNQAVERAKSYNRDGYKKQQDKKAAPQETKELHLTLDADKIRLSGVLALKKLLRAHAGKVPLKVSFVSNQKSVGELSIDSIWGVQPDSTLAQHLGKLPFVQRFEIK